ncbi:MAG: ATPase [Carnobacterium sp.]
MKKIIYSIGLISLLNFGTIAYGETATGTSASSASSSSQNTSSSEGTNSTSQNQTQTSTTAQNQTDNVGQNQTPPVVENRDSSTDKNSGSQKETKNSTTIINETVNNNAKGNNILLMTLTSLSASVTIIGGIIAFVRHLRGRGKKKNPVSKAQVSKNGKTPSNSMTAEPSVSSKKAPNEEKVLTETQQINMQADELLKNHKKQQKEYRRRRR